MKFEYFSPKTIEVLRNAHKKATNLGFEDVGTDHLLLALTDDFDLFHKIGYDHKLIQHEVSMLMGTSDGETEAKTYTPRAKKALENSINEIDHITQITVEPEHLLLSLVKEEDGVAVRALKGLDINLADFTNKIQNSFTA